MYPALIAITTIIALVVIYLVTIAVHEMGHAIVGYWFTKEKIVVYLGSYGDQNGSKRILGGKIEIWVQTNPLKWKGGLCQSPDLSEKQTYFFILGGPVASLLLFVLVLSAYLVLMPQGLLAPLLLIFSGWSGLVFLYNIIPNSKVVSLNQGDMVYTDGTRLRLLRLNKKMSPEYKTAIDHFDAKQYAEAVDLLETIIGKGTKNEFVYRLTVMAHIQLKNYQRADLVQKEQVAKIGNINAEDRVNMALLKTLLKKYDEAIKYYKHLLQTGGNNKFNLGNLGFTLTLVDQFEEAIPYLDKAIAVDKDFAAAYCNRAYAKMMLGMMEEGKNDNDLSLALDPNEAYCYRNIGIYLHSKGLYSEALSNLNKAKGMEDDIPRVDHYIEMCEGKMISIG